MPSLDPNEDLPWNYIAKLVCIGDSGTGKSSLTIRLCEGRFIPSHDVTIGVEFGSRVVPVGPPANAALAINDPIQTPAVDANPNSNINSANVDADAIADAKNIPGPAQRKPQIQSQPQKQKKMKLSLWDTAGQETYKSITRSYFRGASGALLVFDITRRSTFESVTAWLNDLRQIAEPDIVVVLVGNKSDLATDDDDNNDDKADDDDNTKMDSTGLTTDDNDQKRRPRRRQVTASEAQAWCRAQQQQEATSPTNHKNNSSTARNNVICYVETSAKSGAGVERAFLETAERIYQNIEAGRYDLNDRRSGVKGFGGAAGGREGQNVGGGNNASRRGLLREGGTFRLNSDVLGNNSSNARRARQGERCC